MDTGPSTLHLENTLLAPRQAREFSSEVLREWGLADQAELVMLLVSELVTNSVRYSSGDITIRLRRNGGLYVEVVDSDAELPHIERPEELGERGRGLLLINALSQEWGAEPLDHGKCVWLRLPISTTSSDSAATEVPEGQ